MRTCIAPDGVFCYGIHKPSYSVRNLRSKTKHEVLGIDQALNSVDNHINFPDNDVEVTHADWIFEIANPFSFRGTTFIGKRWADRSAENYERIKLEPLPEVSLSQLLSSEQIDERLISKLPRPLLLSLATSSTDPEDLIQLAQSCCLFATTKSGDISGLEYRTNGQGGLKAAISDHALFEAVANNPALPDDYKTAMVIRPGAQGASEIVGDYHDGDETHIYEYLRRNSYIGGGHYAANMAEDAIRYTIESLQQGDIVGLRHLYYQRTYIRLADALGVELNKHHLSEETLEDLRKKILSGMEKQTIPLTATLWGWNFGFDYAPSGYRLHASHQQIHQQYALIPHSVAGYQDGFSQSAGSYTPFSSGDMITEIIAEYHATHGKHFFENYMQAITNNKRMDGRTDRDSDLVVWQDENVMLFVPKAQTSQWELQLITKPDKQGQWPGNVVETDMKTRHSIDKAILKAQKALAGCGARMVSSIEYSKRFDSLEQTQPLLYCLLPKLPESPGAFSESQHRFINGHYPEDFAAVCRRELPVR